MPFIILHYMQFKWHRNLDRSPLRGSQGSLEGILASYNVRVCREQVVGEKTKRFLRNLNRRTARLERFALLVSVDSLRSLPASQDSPLGYRFLRSPQPQSSHCSLGAVALLVSVDSFASFRLRRQPTGLTFGSLPSSIPNTELCRQAAELSYLNAFEWFLYKCICLQVPYRTQGSAAKQLS